MTIRLPERLYLSLTELQVRWNCKENDILESVATGRLTPSMYFSEDCIVLQWREDENSAANDGDLTLEPILQRDTGEEIESVRGWLYLQEPNQTGPFACSFGVVSHDAHPRKALWSISCLGLRASVDLSENRTNVVFMLSEILRFEEMLRSKSDGAGREHPSGVGTRERSSMLRIIGLLLEEDTTDPKWITKSIAKLERPNRDRDVGFSTNTISKYVHLVREAVELKKR